MNLSFAWEYQLKNERNRFIREFLLDDSSLYMLIFYDKKGFYESKLICFDFSTSQIRWTFLTNNCCTNIKLTQNGLILCGSMSSGQIFGIDKVNGNVIWTFTAPVNAMRSVPPNIGWISDVVEDKILISEVNCSSGNVWCLNSLDGSIVWSFKFIGHSYNFSIQNGKVYHSAGYNVFCNDFLTGQLLWQYEVIGETGYIHPVVNICSMALVFGYGYFIALDATDGTLVNRVNFEEWKDRYVPILIEENKLYIVQPFKQLLCLNAEANFSPLWSSPIVSHKTGNRNFVYRDKAFYFLEDNVLVSIAKDTGDVLESVKVKFKHKFNDVVFFEDSAILYDVNAGYFAKFSIT